MEEKILEQRLDEICSTLDEMREMLEGINNNLSDVVKEIRNLVLAFDRDNNS